MYATEQRTELDKQSEIIKSALIYLASCCDGANEKDGNGFNGIDTAFGHELAGVVKRFNRLSPRQEFQACKMMRKYWRQLKKVDIVLPNPFLNRYEVQPGKVLNLSKGSEYLVELIGDDTYSCTCPHYENSSTDECAHIQVYKAGQAKPKAVAAVMTPAPSVETVITDDEVSGYEPIEMLPGIFATEGQAKALEALDDFINGGKTIHLLSGFAGTGKTLLLQAWISNLRKNRQNLSVVFTAPTNKATEVLRTMAAKWQLGIDCQTCAKLLKLRPRINYETGREEFIKSYSEDAAIQDYDLVVIDECSMVSEELWRHLSEEANLFTRLLFVGDWAQLPPVNEPISQSFLAIDGISHLDEVKRYDGAIAVVAEDLRRNLQRRGEPIISTEHSTDKTKGTFVMDRSSWRDYLIRAFSSDKSLDDPNYCRALAWRNKTVNELNTFIRGKIKGQGIPRFVNGERLLAIENYGEDRQVATSDLMLSNVSKSAFVTLINTSAEMEVVHVAEDILPINGHGWNVWRLAVRLISGDGGLITIPVLHESEIKDFEACQKAIKQDAMKAKGAERGQLWDRFYSNRKKFAWVDYAYAMTVHKSQGSTFENAFIDMGDILSNKTKSDVMLPTGDKQLIYERNQLLYVALTRASHRVFIFE